MIGTKSSKLENKKIALCVTGSIAAIEAPKLARELMRHGAEVVAYMTKDAQKIIHPNALEFATQREVVIKLTGKLEHLYEFDLILIAPATAATIGKIAHGIADTPVTALALSAKAKVLIASAMHLSMYEHQILKENLQKLKKLGYGTVEPRLDEGAAKLARIEDIVDAAIFELHKKDLKGLKILVTSGPTLEYIDPIRVITNKSSGRMGVEVAREAFFRGAHVKLIYGTGSHVPPDYLNVTHVETSREMLAAVEKENCDVFISAAAVSDFTTKSAEKKIAYKKPFSLKLIPVPKILERIKNRRAFKVGFKAVHNATKEELLKAATKSLKDYNLDLAVANDVSKGVFGSEKNEVYLVSKNGAVHMPLTTKAEIAEKILDTVTQHFARKLFT
ncbi:MAG: bifunctional phosphopantothenoylcysteine decarboxylase/phosphopantothenate--cysteine ligase CoaBC [Candidatus Hydrothermarchaeota archaeon]|nr:bifunctional phosphopantothenoylcysteine decarboxylase/phosphopantothenate--cysteine ligase CoaBC [Candidatus Hydrothermarchaeota archaeon]